MYKLRDDIPFNKLEELGFKYYDSVGKYVYPYSANDDFGLIMVNIWNRVFTIKNADSWLLDIIFEMISKGYIEQAEEG